MPLTYPLCTRLALAYQSAVLINPTNSLIQSKKAKLHIYRYMCLSWNRVVCIKTTLGAARPGVRLPAEARDLSFFQHVQTCSENHGAYYSIDAVYPGTLSSGVKRLEPGTGYRLYLVTGLRMNGATPPLPAS